MTPTRPRQSQPDKPAPKIEAWAIYDNEGTFVGLNKFEDYAHRTRRNWACKYPNRKTEVHRLIDAGRVSDFLEEFIEEMQDNPDHAMIGLEQWRKESGL